MTGYGGAAAAGRQTAYSAQASRVVDLDAIRHNVAVLRRASPSAELMAVVKADAYAHGAPAVARAALEAGATWLGVAVLEEALELRRAGITAPVLAWLAAPGAAYDAALAEDIDVAAHSVGQLEEIAGAARVAGLTARVHLKAETGMWRGGASAGEWPQLVATARLLENEGSVRVVGVMSHLACADEPGATSVKAQLVAFDEAVDVALEAGLRPRMRHIANSAATLGRPESHYDLVRCGLAVYGVSPFPDPAAFHAPLLPAMRLRGRLTLVKPAPAGACVSYGHTYETNRATRLGVVPLGYADGVPRLLSNRVGVGAQGRTLPIAGRVCMDQLVIDVGDAPLEPGDEVTLLGPGHSGEPTVHEWAEAAGTIPYEILTGLGRTRVPLRYLRES